MPKKVQLSSGGTATYVYDAAGVKRSVTHQGEGLSKSTDYSARCMDGATGRFTTMDPLAEEYYGISPYVYCANNPMRFVDPDGKQIIMPPVLEM